MRQRGYSLVQALMVLCLTTILLAVALLRFGGYARHHRTEAQTRMLYTELLQARANALFQRRTVRVLLYRDHFEVYSSSRDRGGGAQPVRSQTLGAPVTCNGSGDAARGYPLDFDAKGLADNRCSICLETGDGTGAPDSVKISVSRVSIGKKDKGDECKADNITAR